MSYYGLLLASFKGGLMFEGARTLEDIGACLKEERLKQGLTIAELARRSQVSAQTISRMESGKTNAYYSTFIAVVCGLGKSKEVFGIEQ